MPGSKGRLKRPPSGSTWPRRICSVATARSSAHRCAAARASIPAAVAELLDPGLSGQAFDAARLFEAVGAKHGQAVLDKLLTRGVLVPACHP